MIQRTIELRLLALANGSYRAFEHFCVKREANFVNLSALLVAKQLAGAPDLEIVRREGEARAELLE